MSDEEKRPEGEATPGEAIGVTQPTENLVNPTAADAASPAEEGARVPPPAETTDEASTRPVPEAGRVGVTTIRDEGEVETTTRSRTPSQEDLAAVAAALPISVGPGTREDRPAHSGSIAAAMGSEGTDQSSSQHNHGHGHVAPMTMLLGVLGALIILTVMTVAVTMVDLGGQGNFLVAMAIATVKAALVMGYFMHLVWDSKLNAIVFLSSFLFVVLFLGMALLDRQEYQMNMDDFAESQALQAK